MLSTAVMWNRVPLAQFLLPAPTGSSETLLVGVIEFVSLVFLVVGGLAFLRIWRTSSKRAQRETMPPPDRMQMNGRRQQGVGLALSFAVIVPMIALLLLGLGGTATSFLAFSPVPTSTPTKIPRVTPTKALPTVGKTPTFTLPALPGNALVKSGELTIGTSPIFPEQVSVDPNDPQKKKLVGFDVDLITKIAQLLHLQPNIMQMNFNKLTPMLNSNKIDVVIAAYALTNVVSFQSIPYLAPHEVVLTLKSNPKVARFKGLTDLCGHTIGVLKDSNEDSDLKAAQCGHSSSIQVTEEQTVDAVSADLANGKVDATYQDSPTTQYYEGKYPQTFQSAGSIPGTQEGMLVRSDNTPLSEAIQAAFAQLEQNGTYNQLLKKYNLTPDSILSSGTTMEDRVGKMPEII